MDKSFFLKKIVGEWIKRDIERMRSEIPAKDGLSGNINFPLALCVLTYIDTLGGYLLGRDIIGETELRIETYINECFPKNTKQQYKPKILTMLFRHGLTHSYFPKGTITRANSRPAMQKNEDLTLVLDIECLIEDFLLSLVSFSHKLEDKKFEDRKKQFEKSIEEDLLKCQAELATLLAQSNKIKTQKAVSFSGVPMYGSLASTYPGPVKFIKLSTGEDIAKK